jgi:hypothetical protein
LKDSWCLPAETSEPLQLGEALSSVPVSRISGTTRPIRDPHDGSWGCGCPHVLRPQTNRALPSSQLNEAVTLSTNMMWLYPQHPSAWLVLPGCADGELSSFLILTSSPQRRGFGVSTFSLTCMQRPSQKSYKVTRAKTVLAGSVTFLIFPELTAFR